MSDLSVPLQARRSRKLSPSMRFELFTRDLFTCQYCGRVPPEVKLVIDHVVPFSAGGTTASDNLITSCHECNAGKADVLIPEGLRIPRQKRRTPLGSPKPRGGSRAGSGPKVKDPSGAKRKSHTFSITEKEFEQLTKFLSDLRIKVLGSIE